MSTQMKETEEIETKTQDNKKVMKSLSPTKVIIPMLIGVGFTVWMFLTDKEFKFSSIAGYFATASFFWLLMAILVLFIRDFAYIYRIRYLTNRQLTWKGSMYSIFLWEFSSAVSPSAVGGTAVASFILTKEGIPFGKSLAYVVVSAVLDNAFFIVFGGIVIIGNFAGIYGVDIFPTDEVLGDLGIPISADAIRILFYANYVGITIYTLLMALGLFVKPTAIKWLFLKVTSIGFLKKFRKATEKQGDELVNASAEIKGFAGMYWFRAITSTAVVWIARYFIVNCLIMAISYGSLGVTDNYYILSRHVILWVIILLGFTPGAAGIAEYAFKALFGVFIPKLFVAIVAVLWRVVTYYPYLIIGIFALPMWIRRVFKREVAEENAQTLTMNLHKE